MKKKFKKTVTEELVRVELLLHGIKREIEQIRQELRSDYKDGKEKAIQAAAKIYSRGSGAGEYYDPDFHSN
jgi:hypothetical protein